jgi:hypothetical protein
VRAAAAAAAAVGVTAEELTKAEQRKAEAAERTRLRLEKLDAETAAQIREETELRARCRVPPPEELDVLKRMFGLRPRKGK